MQAEPEKKRRSTQRAKLARERREISSLTNRLAEVITVPDSIGPKLLADWAKWAVIAQGVMDAAPQTRARWEKWLEKRMESRSIFETWLDVATAPKPPGIAAIEERLREVFTKGRAP